MHPASFKSRLADSLDLADLDRPTCLDLPKSIKESIKKIQFFEKLKLFPHPDGWPVPTHF